MKLIGLMIARNEDWVIGFSLRTALRWVDHMVVLDHASTDKTPEIIAKIIDENPGKITLLNESNPVWMEMAHRQRTLDEGRKLGGTHFAIIDADEVITGNLINLIRPLIEALSPGDVLNLPTIPAWKTIDRYRDDQSVWSRSQITVAFRDNGKMFWGSANDGYDHHSRIPRNSSDVICEPYKNKDKGGVFHLQFANWRRLKAKHYWYRMVETIRWPGRETPEQINKRYDEALDERDLRTKICHPAWLVGLAEHLVHLDLDAKPWFEDEIKTIWNRFGADPFRGLDLPNEIIGDPYRPPKGIVISIPPEIIPATPVFQEIVVQPTPIIREAVIREPVYEVLPPTPYTREPIPHLPPLPSPVVERYPERFPERAPGPARHSYAGLSPWLWFCEDCGVIGTLLSSDGAIDAQKKLTVAHGAASENCRGRGLKLVPRDEIVSTRILGKVRLRPYPLIVSYYTNDEYGEYAKALSRSIRLHRLDYEIDRIASEELHVESYPLEKIPGEDPIKYRFWKTSVLYKPQFIRKKLEANPGRDIIWIDADAKLLDFPKFLMEERPDFDVSYYHMDVLGNEPFGGTVFYRNTQAVRSLIDQWEAEVKKNPKALDEQSLAKVVRERKDLVFQILPPEYCWVERWMRQKHRGTTPIIEQHAISRPLLNPVRRPI